MVLASQQLGQEVLESTYCYTRKFAFNLQALMCACVLCSSMNCDSLDLMLIVI